MNCNVGWGDCQHKEPETASYVAVSITGGSPCNFCICEIHRQILYKKMRSSVKFWVIGRLPKALSGFRTFEEYGRHCTAERRNKAKKEARRAARSTPPNTPKGSQQ